MLLLKAFTRQLVLGPPDLPVYPLRIHLSLLLHGSFTCIYKSLVTSQVHPTSDRAKHDGRAGEGMTATVIIETQRRAGHVPGVATVLDHH
jgi:hypothetical protein